MWGWALIDSDDELMARVKNGDKEAFDLLYRRYESRLRSFFQTFACRYDEARDCVQETFIRLWLARDSYQPIGEFMSYLFRIGRNVWISRVRRLNCRPREVCSEDSDASSPRIYASMGQVWPMDASPEEWVILEYRRWRVRQAVRAVPEPYRTALVLVHLHEMKYAEVADELGIPIGTVKSRISAALGILRDRLKEELL